MAAEHSVTKARQIIRLHLPLMRDSPYALSFYMGQNRDPVQVDPQALLDDGVDNTHHGPRPIANFGMPLRFRNPTVS